MDTTYLETVIKPWIPIIEATAKLLFAVVAGLWTPFLVRHLRQRDRANVEIQKIQNETKQIEQNMQKQELSFHEGQMKFRMLLEKHKDELVQGELKIKELELKIRKQVSISVNIDIDISGACAGHPLVVNVLLTNHGNEATRINWICEPPALTTRLVSFDEKSDVQYHDLKSLRVMLTRDPNLPAKSHVIRAGATENLPFVFQPQQPGLYLISFRAATDAEVRDEAEKFGVQLPTAWTAKRYVHVGGS